MINRLCLHNWRSYEDLDLEFRPGTTFVVAPNGVGKTSLVYGLAWGVFGQHSSVVPKECIRAGAASAEVTVEFGLPDGRQFSISRTAKRRGVPTAKYEIDGARLTETLALAEMQQAFGIELPVAGRLSMMLGGGHIAASDTLNLEGHLHQAFGVSHILNAAEIARSVARQAEKARESLRSTARQRIENRAALESEIDKLEAEIAQLSRHGAELERVRDTAATQLSLIERHVALAGQLQRYERQSSQLKAAIEGVLGRTMSPDGNEQIGSDLRNELETSESDLAKIVEEAIAARSAVHSAQQAVKLLDGDDGVCPTCMRPLSVDERCSATSAHRAEWDKAESEVRRLEEVRQTRHAHAQEISRLLTQLEALHPPRIATGDASVATRAEFEAVQQKASTDLDANNQRIGAARARMDLLRVQIASDDQIQEEERNLRLVYRREAASLAGARVLREAADRMIKSRIEPMANEVRGRWKHLFTSNGLTFKPDGSITRSRDGEELSWDTLSGGERTWARIVTHLIVMSATTSLPFAWFDEPLEHLDPQLRHAVAATLATATARGSPRQLLVTTYEHSIAQQLAEDTDGAEVIAIRESEASFDPSRWQH